jgi:hypothetical protein
MSTTKPPAPRIPALSTRKKILFSLFTLIVFSFLLYTLRVGTKTYNMYRYFKSNELGLQGVLEAADPVLGMAPVPGSRGSEIMPLGPPIPVRYDDRGFRVPDAQAHAPAAGDTPLVLFLGCSFTFGAYCPAEETYPHLLAQELGYRYINAGRCGYGLSQMLLLARRLIPEYKPDYVVVQYSWWLPHRATEPYGPTYFGRLPTPYFTESREGELTIHPPVFSAKSIEYGAIAAEYRGRPMSILDFASFAIRAGIPLFVHDDFHLTLDKIKRATGLTPPPSANGQRVVDHVYREIARLCEENGTRLIIAVIHDSVRLRLRFDLPQVGDALIVDTRAALLDPLREPSQKEYSQAYYQWRGTPPVLVDPHPNEQAHRIIARELAEAIGGLKTVRSKAKDGAAHGKGRSRS